MGRFSASNTNVPKLTATAGVQSAVVEITATSDGTGTGVIPANASIVSAGSGNSAHIITLPSYVGGNEILILPWVA